MKKVHLSLQQREKQILDEIAGRHDMIIMIWDMFKASGFPELEYVSSNISRYGYEASQYIAGEVYWLDGIFEEDKARVERGGYYYIINGGTRFTQEYRLCGRDGSIEWVSADTSIIRDEKGHACFIETVINDITKSKTFEQRLLQNQAAMQQEVLGYMDRPSGKSTREIFQELIKEQKIEQLQKTFAEVFGVHTAIVGMDGFFYTNLAGPKAETGIFYDLKEMKVFKDKIMELNENFENGLRNIILTLENPGIRISGVPVINRKRQVATWIVCCLKERNGEEIESILHYMRVLADGVADYFGNIMDNMSAKGYAFEHYRMSKKLELQNELIELYQAIEDTMTPVEKAELILQTAGLVSKVDRAALYEMQASSSYLKCVYEWFEEEVAVNFEHALIMSVKAVPNPLEMIGGEGAAVLNSTSIPKEWRSILSDLHAKAAVLLPIKTDTYQGYLCFLKVTEDRVWEDEIVEFYKKIRKIIEKVLLKY